MWIRWHLGIYILCPVCQYDSIARAEILDMEVQACSPEGSYTAGEAMGDGNHAERPLQLYAQSLALGCCVGQGVDQSNRPQKGGEKSAVCSAGQIATSCPKAMLGALCRQSSEVPVVNPSHHAHAEMPKAVTAQSVLGYLAQPAMHAYIAQRSITVAQAATCKAA